MAVGEDTTVVEDTTVAEDTTVEDITVEEATAEEADVEDHMEAVEVATAEAADVEVEDHTTAVDHMELVEEVDIIHMAVSLVHPLETVGTVSIILERQLMMMLLLRVTTRTEALSSLDNFNNSCKSSLF